MGFTAALGFACLISLSACGESGRVEVSDRERMPVATVTCRRGTMEACGRGPLEHEVSEGKAGNASSLRGIPHALRELECNQGAAKPAAIPLELSRALPIVIPPGKTSSRRTVRAADAMTKVEPPKLEVPEAEVTKASVLEPKALAILTSKPAAYEAYGESKRTALPPLPPLRNQGKKALRSLDHLDQADLALASLQMAVQTSAVRHIATDVEPTSSEETEQDNDDADQSAPLRQLESNQMDPVAPELFQHRSAVSDSPLEPAPVVELRPTHDASRLELGRTRHSVTVQEDPTSPKASLEDSQRVETVIHQLFPGSRIECQREPARLIVRGYARNERQAIDIISTIRRSQLIPVIDLIEIRAQER